MMKSYKKVLLGCSTALFSVMLSAQDATSNCISSDCNALGYTKTTAECLGQTAIKCPFDTSKAFCIKKNCSAGTRLKDGECVACTGNSYSVANSMLCEVCPSGTVANADHTACEKTCTSCEGYTKDSNQKLRCLYGQTELNCTDCDGVKYYKCVGEAIELDPVRPTEPTGCGNNYPVTCGENVYCCPDSSYNCSKIKVGATNMCWLIKFNNDIPAQKL